MKRVVVGRGRSREDRRRVSWQRRNSSSKPFVNSCYHFGHGSGAPEPVRAPSSSSAALSTSVGRAAEHVITQYSPSASLRKAATSITPQRGVNDQHPPEARARSAWRRVPTVRLLLSARA